MTINLQMLVFIVMGVSGSGKSTVAKMLATRLNAPFYDADDYHPPANVAKMSAGRPLNDDDRAPWLDSLHEVIARHIKSGTPAVLTCSALKQAYRARLRGQCSSVTFVYLDGSFDLIWQRMQQRKNHYMKAGMLQSQFDTLEIPTADQALAVSIELPPELIVDQIIKAFKPA